MGMTITHANHVNKARETGITEIMTKNTLQYTVSTAARLVLDESIRMRRELSGALMIISLMMGIILITYGVSIQIFPILGTSLATSGITLFAFVGLSIVAFLMLILLPDAEFVNYCSEKLNSFVVCPGIIGIVAGFLSIGDPLSGLLFLMVIAGAIGLVNYLNPRNCLDTLKADQPALSIWIS